MRDTSHELHNFTMGGRIEKRFEWGGTGMMNSPERLAELDERRALHDRLIRGKPNRTFKDWLEEKMHGRPEEHADGEESREDGEERGAKDPHLGLSPGQDPGLAQSRKGKRGGRVIVKG